MGRYNRLTQNERYQIEALKKSEISVRGIASVLNRSPSSICREIHRNANGKYRALLAQGRSRRRRKGIGPPERIDGKLGARIREKLESQQFSPEQISQYLRAKKVIISVDTIYKYIYQDWTSGGKLHLNLRRKRRYRRSRQSHKNLKNTGKRVNQRWIAERPKVVEERNRIGDLERDTVLGKRGSAILLTIVDRATRFTRIKKIKTLNAELAHKATVELLRGTKVNTITNDNGAEFAFHKKTEAELEAKVYFNDPYCSWQRGTNENTNGLIRQYYPKGYDFNLVSDQEIQRMQDILNSRPRKCLGFKTSIEVEKHLSRVLR